MSLAHTGGMLAVLIGLAVQVPSWLPGAPPGAPRAVVESRGSVVVGTDRGLYVQRADGWHPAETHGAVRDLAADESVLWVATERALYAWEDGAPAPLAVPIAAGARVDSVAVDREGATWAATEVGLFRRDREGRHFERDTSIPAGRVRSVRAAGDSVWAASRSRVWRRRGTGSFEPVLQPTREGRWELCGVAELGGTAWLCVPDGLWQLRDGGASWIGFSERPLHAVAREGSTLWVASERGLAGYTVRDFDGATSPDAASRPLPRPARALASGARGLLIATPAGVARLAPNAALGELGLRRPVEGGGEAERLRRAVLSYLDLGTSTLTRAGERARRAGLLPLVRATFGVDRDRSHGRDLDEVFTSGELRSLGDRQRDHDTATSLELQITWNLTRLSDPDDLIALSRERRERIELRDQVLERVNRLYFERQQVLTRLRAEPAEDERGRLELRERELRAGLDGWSGGAFSRLVSDSPPPSGSSR